MNFLLKKPQNLHAEALELTVTLVKPSPALREAWVALERENEVPFFLSWAWIGTWLHLLPPELDPQVIEIRDNSRIVGLGIVLPQRKKVFLSKVPTLYLHATGIPKIDRLYIEHNGLLFAKGQEARGLKALFGFLKNNSSQPCFYCPGVAQGTPLFDSTEDGVRGICESEFPSPYVDFDILGDRTKPILDLLKKTTVRHLRKNIQVYSEQGSIEVHRADTASEALEYFNGLKELHQARFTSKQEEGAFASAFFEKFHRELIESHYGDGFIDLLLIKAGAETIGYLYLFRSHGTAYFYQSGFHYQDSRQPGLLSHYCALDYYRSQNLSRYDFLAHDAQYKRAFSNAEYLMRWIFYVKDSPFLGFQQKIVALARKIRSLTSPT